MGEQSQFPPKVRGCAVRMVLGHQGEHSTPCAAIRAIAAKVGCTAETLRKWARQAERDAGRLQGRTTAGRAQRQELERENKELRRANEILRKASAFFAQAELDRWPR